MSYYLEQLQKKGVQLTKEQITTRKTLKLTDTIPTMKLKSVNAMRTYMDKLVEEEMKKGKQ